MVKFNYHENVSASQVKRDKVARILAAGIAHGPYPSAPEDLIKHYLQNRPHIMLDDKRTEEQFIADIQSEWQYDHHQEAVHQAMLDERITADQALFMSESILRPWFIGSR